MMLRWRMAALENVVINDITPTANQRPGVTVKGDSGQTEISLFHGVSYCMATRKWISSVPASWAKQDSQEVAAVSTQISIKTDPVSSRHQIGKYDDQKDAALAHDKFCRSNQFCGNPAMVVFNFGLAGSAMKKVQADYSTPRWGQAQQIDTAIQPLALTAPRGQKRTLEAAFTSYTSTFTTSNNRISPRESQQFAQGPPKRRPLVDHHMQNQSRVGSAACSIKNALLSLALASEKGGFGVVAKCAKVVANVATKPKPTAVEQENSSAETSIAQQLLLLASN